MNNKSIGVLGDQPFLRSTRDLQDQVEYGCGTTELYNKDITGVLDNSYYGQRSVRDQEMLQQFGCGGGDQGVRLENYGYTEKQKQAIRFANRNKPVENYCGGVGSPFAKTSDMPTNPWSGYANTVVLKPN